MAEITFIDQTEKGLGRLIHQWKDKPNVVGLLTSYLENIQELETVYQQLNDERGIYTAIGEQLDVLGIIIGESRDGRNDREYRSALLARITLNTSKGTPEDMIQNLQVLTSQGLVNIFEYFPAHIYGYVGGGVGNSVAISFNSSSPAGVSTRLIFDQGGESFIGAGAAIETSDLQNDEQFDIQVEDGVTSNLQVIDTGVFSVGTNSFLPHVIDTEIINPLAAVLPSNPLPVEVGALILENGDGLVQNEDLPVAYQIIG